MIKTSRQKGDIERKATRLKIFRRQAERVYKNIVDANEDFQLNELDERIKALEEKLNSYQENFQTNALFDLDLISATGLGENLIKARLILSWSQSELARRCSIKRLTLVRYENRCYEQAPLSTVLHVASVLKLETDALRDFYKQEIWTLR